MRVMDPKPITADVVKASNLTDPAPLWSATSAYLAGTTVRQADTHHRYKALKDSPVGTKPSEACTGLTPTWSDLGVDNTWACFDDSIDTRSTGANGVIDQTLDSSRCDSLALFGLADASSVDVEMRDGTGAVVFTSTTSLANFEVSNWYEYFFGDFTYRRDLVLDMPIYGQSSLHLVIHGVGDDDPSCGSIRICQATEIGNTIFDSELGFVDWSTDDEDKWGKADLEQGPSAKKADIDVQIDTADLDNVIRLFESVRGRLAVYDCNNTTTAGGRIFERGIILGRVRSLKVPIQGPVVSTISVEIRGVP
ncbi:hypothetical protein DFW101_0316 [Solidesulfovibrio carbinoliphilus subsp. oakridgensis]|uniref:Uncharacterized protein n=2 Tax=Solidesulfovibrio carbinoliphilus TaxID=345370 RepID=G7QD27_9BACT|nr:hypothetical protein DFW101_0316 [Solidesulfovibrio carbinoliphilus subsp. oakridgensis]